VHQFSLGESTVPRILSETDVADFRERLCEAATTIYVEKGPDGLNMRELAGRMGVSAMTPYRYFKDKDEILSAIRARAFNRFATQLEQALALPGTPPERSAAVGRAYVRFALEQSCCYRLMFDLSSPRLAPLPELFAAERRARATMTDHVRLMVTEGYFKGDPDLIGPVLWAGLHGVVTLHLSGAVARDGEFEIILAETMRVLSGAYRTR
jgi:AcrR family transcriptional regulator